MNVVGKGSLWPGARIAGCPHAVGKDLGNDCVGFGADRQLFLIILKVPEEVVFVDGSRMEVDAVATCEECGNRTDFFTQPSATFMARYGGRVDVN